MTKIKEWIKNHKKELIITSVSATLGAVVGVKLYKFGRKDDETIAEAIALLDRLKLATIGCKSFTCTDFKGAGFNNVVLKDCPKHLEDLVNDKRFDPNQSVTGMAVFLK